MTASDIRHIYLLKAEESLAGVGSEFINGRYNNTANRCYYACFQAAIHALLQVGIRPSGRRDEWGHDFVQAEFNGQLINRRKLQRAYAPRWLRSVPCARSLITSRIGSPSVGLHMP